MVQGRGFYSRWDSTPQLGLKPEAPNGPRKQVPVFHLLLYCRVPGMSPLGSPKHSKLTSCGHPFFMCPLSLYNPNDDQRQLYVRSFIQLLCENFDGGLPNLKDTPQWHLFPNVPVLVWSVAIAAAREWLHEAGWTRLASGSSCVSPCNPRLCNMPQPQLV